MPLSIGRLDLFVRLMDFEGFRSNLPGDRGGETIYGISSRAHPEFFSRIKAQGAWNFDDVFMFYRREYMDTIDSFSRLLHSQPTLASLLFFGKVHGVGINHYTDVVQRFLCENGKSVVNDEVWGPKTASATLGLSANEIVRLKNRLIAEQENVAARRVTAVGVYPRGIRNRVNKEYRFAFATNRVALYSA